MFLDERPLAGRPGSMRDLNDEPDGTDEPDDTDEADDPDEP